MSLRLSLALIRKNLTNIFKTTHHVEQNKENKFAVMSTMYLYSEECKEISVENLYVGVNAKTVRGHDKLRVKDNQGLSQLYIDLGTAKSEAPVYAF